MEIQINIDCADPDALSAWYCDALGYVLRGGEAQYRSIVPASGASGPKIVFQQVPEPRVTKNRVHLDVIYGDEMPAQVQRFETLGATRLSPGVVGEGDYHWVVMADPEGNEICICDL